MNLATRRAPVAVLAISHPPKAAQAKAINSITGSLAFVAAARLVFIASAEPETERRVLLAVKNNIGPEAAGLGYWVVSKEIDGGISTSCIEWDRAPVTITANEAIQAGGARKPSAVDEAQEFLRDFLSNCPRVKDEVEKAAKSERISPATLRRAKDRLGVASAKTGFGDGWEWRLRN